MDDSEVVIIKDENLGLSSENAMQCSYQYLCTSNGKGSTAKGEVIM